MGTFLALLQLKKPTLADLVMERTNLSELPDGALDLLWSSESSEVRVKLCEDDNFVQRLTAGQGQDIILSNDETMILPTIESLPYCIDDFERLGEMEAKRFVMALVRHPNTSISRAVMRKPILESIDDDVLAFSRETWTAFVVCTLAVMLSTMLRGSI